MSDSQDRERKSAASQALYNSLYLIKSGNFDIAAGRILAAADEVAAPSPAKEAKMKPVDVERYHTAMQDMWRAEIEAEASYAESQRKAAAELKRTRPFVYYTRRSWNWFQCAPTAVRALIAFVVMMLAVSVVSLGLYWLVAIVGGAELGMTAWALIGGVIGMLAVPPFIIAVDL